VRKLFVGDVFFYAKIWPKLTHPLQNADFQSIFVGSNSAVTPSKKVQLILIEIPVSAFQWA